MAAETEEETCIRKFYGEDEEDEDETADMFIGMGVTPDETFSFNLAFNLITGDERSTVTKAEVIDVFLAFGYTFQPCDIDKLCESTIADTKGNYTVESLLEAFAQWKREQINPSDMAVVFKILSRRKRLLSKFPEFDGAVDPKKLTFLDKENEIFRNVLNEILCTDPGSEVSDAEVAALIDEISSAPDGKISFQDFIRMFTVTGN